MKRASIAPKIDAEVLLQAAKLSAPEARFLVSNYYDSQEQRKRADMQLRHLGDKEHATILEYTANVHALTENQVKRALLKYAEGSLVGRWCMSHVGVGEVITAGLLAHLDITKAPTAGHFMRFAGLDPTCKWEKGQKRPYCAPMKQIMFHLGECFKRSSNHADSYYGGLYRERKAIIVDRNERGHYAERAKTFVTLSADVRKTLAEGKLPSGNLDRQACNWAAKIFLCHLHAVMFWDRFGKAPPKPFAIQHLGHAHEIRVQNAEMFPGFAQAYYGAFAEAAE